MERILSLFLLPPAEVTADYVDHSFGILKYLAVLESDHFDSVIVEISLSLAIPLFGFFIKVDVSVELDREPFGGAIEIQDIRSGTMLPSKLPAVDLRCLSDSPKSGLGRRHVLSQCGAQSGKLWKVI